MKYASIVERLIATASPNKKTALERRGIASEGGAKEVLNHVRQTCMSFDRKNRRHFVHHKGFNIKDAKHGMKVNMCRSIGFTRKY